MDPTAGEPPDEKAIDCARCQVPGFRPSSHCGVGSEEPGQFRGRKVWVQHKPGPLGEPRLIGVMLPAEIRGPAILPDDGPRHGSSGNAVPDNDRLALVADANGGQCMSIDASGGK